MQLTQDVIYSQTGLNVDSIKSLIIVGFGLTDVSILREARSVETLNLASNQIDTLSHFGNCSELQQLLLRDNNIREFSEIEHLKDLKHLKTLTLSQNPFCETLGLEYRAMILRILPNLIYLDTVMVTRGELIAALRSVPSLQQAREERISDQNSRALVPSPVGSLSATSNGQLGRGSQTEFTNNQVPEVVLQVSQVPQLPHIPRVLRVAPLPRVLRVAPLPRVPQVPQLPQVPQVPQLPRVPQVPQSPRVPRVPRVSQLQQAYLRSLQWNPAPENRPLFPDGRIFSNLAGHSQGMRNGFRFRHLEQVPYGRSTSSGYADNPRGNSNVLTATLNLTMELNLNELTQLKHAVRNRIRSMPP